MLTSANYVRDEGVLNSGQVIEPVLTQDLLNDPNTRTYFHRIPGARFVMPDGAEIIFRGGMFATNSEDLKKELDKIANRPTSLIYTKDEVAKQIDAEMQKAAKDATTPAGDAAKLSTD